MFVKFVRVFNNVTADSIAVKTGIMSPVQCTNYCFNTLTCDLVRYTESDKTCNLLTNLQEDLFVVTLSGPSSSSDVSTYARTVSYICQPMHEQWVTYVYLWGMYDLWVKLIYLCNSGELNMSTYAQTLSKCVYLCTNGELICLHMYERWANMSTPARIWVKYVYLCTNGELNIYICKNIELNMFTYAQTVSWISLQMHKRWVDLFPVLYNLVFSMCSKTFNVCDEGYIIAQWNLEILWLDCNWPLTNNDDVLLCCILILKLKFQ